MDFTMRLFAFFALLAVFSLGAGSDNNPDDCKPITITCVCGIGDKKTFVPLELKTEKRIDFGYKPIHEKSNCVSASDPYQACANMSCSLSANSSDSGSSFKNNLISNFYPIEIEIPPGGLSEGHRHGRATDPCRVPPLQNAAVKCWIWPSWITCEVSCIYGHALPDGSESLAKNTINCRLSENVWKPHDFQDCKPYLNCKARLTKPGTLKCKELVTEPAYCEISCLDYDEFEATNLQKYECVDEHFGSILPHCATLKSGETIIKKPQ